MIYMNDNPKSQGSQSDRHSSSLLPVQHLKGISESSQGKIITSMTSSKTMSESSQGKPISHRAPMVSVTSVASVAPAWTVSDRGCDKGSDRGSEKGRDKGGGGGVVLLESSGKERGLSNDRSTSYLPPSTHLPRVSARDLEVSTREVGVASAHRV